MISNVGAQAVRNTHQENEAKEASRKSSTVAKQGDTSKIEELKTSIANGEYQLDIKALAAKIADEIL